MSPTWRFITSRPVYFLAFGIGTGLSPKAPGTVGTLVGYPLYFLMIAYLPFEVVMRVLAVMYLIGIWICDVAGKAVGLADHPGIVWDEIVAMALVLCYSPQNIYGYIGAFVAFRLFDIIKPWPINLIDERMKNGHGVMLDDLLAAGYSIALIQLVIYFPIN
ncbi:MAG: phosphatidylglycerophosphatase A [Nitrosomonas communis]|nr:phosphatidylglycerophosphatase A [Nitrosomonas communis]MCO6427629.1 phosphatidylglycerophosphatase A [Nitrosomonas communis]